MVYIKENTFTNNMGVVHKTLGGALSVTCDAFNINTEWEHRGQWHYISRVPDGDQDRMVTVTYLNPNGLDEFVETPDFETYKQATCIEGNTFDSNLVGQAGSAIFIKQLSYVFIQDENLFKLNQPIYSFIPEARISPWYKYLALESHTSWFHDNDNLINNELEKYSSMEDPYVASLRLHLPNI
jgi:hypothetical protein